LSVCEIIGIAVNYEFADNVFKVMFAKDNDVSRGALMGLLEAATNQNVADVVVVQNEPVVDSLFDKQVRFDVNCKFNDGSLAEIEVTLYPNPLNEISRMIYYTSKLIVGQSIKNEDYKKLNRAYQISIFVNIK
jgi:predicted transposase/invertase (TIGR01784 family)